MLDIFLLYCICQLCVASCTIMMFVAPSGCLGTKRVKFRLTISWAPILLHSGSLSFFLFFKKKIFGGLNYLIFEGDFWLHLRG